MNELKLKKMLNTLVNFKFTLARNLNISGNSDFSFCKSNVSFLEPQSLIIHLPNDVPKLCRCPVSILTPDR